MVVTLYKMDASPPVRSVYMVIEALKIPDIKYVDVDLLADDHMKENFLKLNPQHTIPMLTDDDLVLWDSHAIATYLINKYSKDSPLYPNDVKKRAIIDMRLHFDGGILYSSLREVDEPIFFKGATSMKSEGLEKIKSAYDFTEKFLAKTSWIAGEELTVADLCCVATVSTLNELLPIEESLYPNIIGWWNRCAQLEFYKKGNQPGLVEYRCFLKEHLARGQDKN